MSSFLYETFLITTSARLLISHVSAYLGIKQDEANSGEQRLRGDTLAETAATLHMHVVLDVQHNSITIIDDFYDSLH